MAKQFTIIDGYNLLHVCGFIGSNIGPGTLEKARDRLLGIIARFVREEDRRRTTVVFDSRESDLPNRFERHGILVEFASEYEDADQLIEQLIQKHSAVRQLTVVSSDHRLHKAARVRSAHPIDSDDWLEAIQENQNRQKNQPTDPTGDRSETEKPKDGSSVDVDYWVDEMDLGELDLAANEDGASPTKENKDFNNGRNLKDDPNLDDDLENGLDSENPFPPGYADDLFE